MSDCQVPGTSAPTGHVEILACDDDPSLPTDGSAREADRVTFVITLETGFTWTPDAFGVLSPHGSVSIVVDGWGPSVFTLIDGGNPGSRSTGELNGSGPITTDRMRYSTFGLCNDGWLNVTSGNITYG